MPQHLPNERTHFRRSVAEPSELGFKECVFCGKQGKELMRHSLLKFGLIFSVLHVVVTWSLLIATFAATTNPLAAKESPTVLEQIVSRLTSLLMLPLSALWTPWMSENLPNMVEWLFFFANSALWGFGLAFLLVQLEKRFRPKTAG